MRFSHVIIHTLHWIHWSGLAGIAKAVTSSEDHPTALTSLLVSFHSASCSHRQGACPETSSRMNVVWPWRDRVQIVCWPLLAEGSIVLLLWCEMKTPTARKHILGLGCQFWVFLFWCQVFCCRTTVVPLYVAIIRGQWPYRLWSWGYGLWCSVPAFFEVM